MKKAVKIIIVVIIAVTVGLGLGFIIKGKNKSNPTAQTLEVGIKEVCHLSVYESTYKEIMTNGYDGYQLDPFGITSNKYIATMNVKVSIGVDINDGLDIKTKKDIEGNVKSINISLPHCKILDINGIQESIEVLEDRNGLFNNLNQEAYNNAQLEAKEQAEKECKASNVLKEADQRLQDLLVNHCKAIYGDDVKVNVEFN